MNTEITMNHLVVAIYARAEMQREETGDTEETGDADTAHE